MISGAEYSVGRTVKTSPLSFPLKSRLQADEQILLNDFVSSKIHLFQSHHSMKRINNSEK